MIKPVEIAIRVPGAAQDGFQPIEPDVVVTDGEQGATWTLPAFWVGGDEFRFRFAPPRAGRYPWCVRPDGVGAGAVAGQSGVIDVPANAPVLQRFAHGRLRVAPDGRTFQQADGTPFLWLADTWWMAFTRRLGWPDDFARLTEDRVRKGFNVIQVVAGPLPDYDAPEQAFDPAQADEAGWSWEPGWGRIDPAFFDRADRRIFHLIENGLTPCIVGMWAYWALAMGEHRVRRHWRNLVARYGAWPVVWCLAGETAMPTYHTVFENDAEKSAREAREQMAIWSRMIAYVRDLDPYHNPLTLHPKAPGGSRHDVTPGTTLDFEMVQTTHMGYAGLHGHLETLAQSLAATPRLPVLVGEANYEGIMGSSWADIQRFLFWTAMTLGCCGHSYGAQGIWGMNSRREPHRGFTGDWGRGFWEDAMHYSGATQLGVGAAILARYPWEQCRPFEEPAAAAVGRPWSFATGIPGQLSIYYLPANTSDPRHLGVVAEGWMGECLPLRLAAGISWRASFIDPVTGAVRPIGPARPGADGCWIPPRKPSSEDWLLVIEA